MALRCHSLLLLLMLSLLLGRMPAAALPFRQQRSHVVLQSGQTLAKAPEIDALRGCLRGVQCASMGVESQPLLATHNRSTLTTHGMAQISAAVAGAKECSSAS
jgi:hypothetical protein